ncbi:hypothetical protein PNOK_0375800 [Pyrrhoderma noxium]|uniref:Uncharacterized protein n=1 Tax=Pyrrhoderma noxium TaxID=2282107 RepID=A0A286UNF0_9AGAM|nr:hypothetical protein PNOK_0375800 [Pyrrhoderma noxium]
MFPYALQQAASQPSHTRQALIFCIPSFPCSINLCQFSVFSNSFSPLFSLSRRQSIQFYVPLLSAGRFASFACLSLASFTS